VSYLSRRLNQGLGIQSNEPRQKNDSLSPGSGTPAVIHGAQGPRFPLFPIEEAELNAESKIVYYTDPHGGGADRFRQLRMRLREWGSTDKCNSLLITSALPQDGKSTVSLNLATALTEHGRRRVLLIEADLHHPTLTQQLRLKTWPGFADCLEGRLSVRSAIRRVEPLGFYLLPAGEAHGNPSEILQSDEMTNLMVELRLCFDWIVIDAPPLAPLTDAMSLARHVQASLLVVRAGRTPRAAVEQAMGLLDPKRVIGIVLNGIDGLHRAYSKYYGYSPHTGTQAPTGGSQHGLTIHNGTP